MKQPAEIRQGVGDFVYDLYVYGVRIPGVMFVGTIAERINEAAKKQAEEEALAAKDYSGYFAGMCL